MHNGWESEKVPNGSHRKMQYLRTFYGSRFDSIINIFNIFNRNKK